MCINDIFMEHYSQLERGGGRWKTKAKLVNSNVAERKGIVQFIVDFICIIPRSLSIKWIKYTVHEYTMNWIKSQISLSIAITHVSNHFFFEIQRIETFDTKGIFVLMFKIKMDDWGAHSGDKWKKKCHLMNCERYGKKWKSCDWRSVSVVSWN